MYYFERLLSVIGFTIVAIISILVMTGAIVGTALWVLITPFKKRPVPVVADVEEKSETMRFATKLRDALNDYLAKQEQKEAEA
ncbi:hypothetical protein CF138_17280 [Aeromonas hydrophila]|uniref:hypothetical protein n=1 Tax=Aeromonas hydrophila TaxID=644 RepID=UPI0011174C35|nr:hypothetical protein [Aeromonas hydrophila]TNH82853.1 hypothetical protein CF138_17280 [Aeromonas hydrophila]TNI00238.1 hypothetical protein CF136_10585 [Aeromonas hydrophila]TNI92881.1 hypothetical protein CF118_18055 [Aeromonas hydrophila]